MVSQAILDEKISALEATLGVDTGPSEQELLDAKIAALESRIDQDVDDDNLFRQFADVVRQSGAVDIAAGANRGIANVAGFPVDAANAILGFLGVPVSDEPVGGSRSISRAFETVGASTDPENEFLGRVGEEIGAATVPLAPFMRAARAVRPAAQQLLPRVNRFLEPILRGAREAPARFAGGELAIATAAGGGAAIAQEMAPNEPAAEIVGQLVGGLAPSGAVSALKAGSSATANQIRSFTNRGAQEEAARRIQNAAVDPDQAAENLAANTGLFPNQAAPLSGQLTGDSGLLALERAVVRANAEVKGEFDEAITRTNQALRNEVQLMEGAGSVEQAQDFLQERVDGLVNLLDTRTEIAVANARRLVDEAAPALTREESNVIAREQLERALADAQKQEDELWAATDLSQTVDITPLIRARDNILSKRAKATKPADLVPDLLKFIPRVKKDGSVTPKKGQFALDDPAEEIQAFRSRVLAEIRKEAAKDAPNRARIANLNELQGAALQTLAQVQGVGDALDFSRALNQKFRAGPVGKLLKRDFSGREKTPDLLTLENLILPGPKGQVNLNALMEAASETGDATVRQQMDFATRNFLLNRFFQQAVDTSTGRVNPTAAQRFVQQNEQVLERFPDMRQQMADVRSGQELADAMARSGKRLKDNILDARESRAALFIGQKPEKAWQKILGNRRPTQVTRQLIKQLAKDPSGEALQGLKSGFVKHMLAKSELKVLDQNNDARLFGREMARFFKDNEDVIRNSGLFTPDEVNRLRKIIQAAQLVDRSFTSGIPGGSDTAQNLNILAETVGGILGARLGAQVGFSPLIVASRGARLGKALVGEFPEERVRQLIRAAVFDPEIMKTLLTKPTQANARELRRQLRGHMLNLQLEEEQE